MRRDWRIRDNTVTNRAQAGVIGVGLWQVQRHELARRNHHRPRNQPTGCIQHDNLGRNRRGIGHTHRELLLGRRRSAKHDLIRVIEVHRHEATAQIGFFVAAARLGATAGRATKGACLGYGFGDAVVAAGQHTILVAAKAAGGTACGGVRLAGDILAGDVLVGVVQLATAVAGIALSGSPYIVGFTRRGRARIIATSDPRQRTNQQQGTQSHPIIESTRRRRKTDGVTHGGPLQLTKE